MIATRAHPARNEDTRPACRRPTVVSALALVLGCGCIPAAPAQPLPPPRPRDLAPPTPHPEEAHPIEGPLTDDMRARLRDCAEEWSKLKREGSAADMIWSDFARQCLDRK